MGSNYQQMEDWINRIQLVHNQNVVDSTLPTPTISPQDALNEWAAVLIVIGVVLTFGIISGGTNTVARLVFVVLILGMILGYNKLNNAPIGAEKQRGNI